MTSPTFVYFIAPIGGGLIKIGSTKAPVSRLENLQDWSPVRLEILATAPGNLYDEFAIHGAFLSDLSHREWFHPSNALHELIAAVQAIGEIPPAYRGKQPNWATGQPGQKNPKPIKKRSPESFEKGRLSNLARIARNRLSTPDHPKPGVAA